MSIRCPMHAFNVDKGLKGDKTPPRSPLSPHRIPPKAPSIAHSVNTNPSLVPPILPPTPVPCSAPKLPSVLITGGCGFVGSELLDQVIKWHPGTSITVIDLKPPPHRYQSNPDVVFYEADLNHRAAIRQILEFARPEIIFHIAGLIPSASVKDKSLYRKHNFDATKVFIEECINVLVNAAGGSRVKGFIYMSSSDAVKGKRELAGVDERAPYPKTYLGEYAEAKAGAERLVLQENRPEFPTCCLRPHVVIGARSQVIPILHQTLLNNEAAIQIGDNKNLYDVVDSENLCHATLLTAYNLLTVPVRSDIRGPQNHNYNYVDQGYGDSEGNPISAAGHTFFINNMEPVYFWTWVRTIWAYLSINSPPVIQTSEPNTETPILDMACWNCNTAPDELVTFPKVVHNREIAAVKRKTSSKSLRGFFAPSSISTQAPFSFSPTSPLPEPYTPYSPPPPDLPKDSTARTEAKVKLSRGVGLVLASVAEFYSGTICGKEPGMTKNRVIECCHNRWYRGDKAGHVLGYWGGLMKDSKGYGLGGIGVWHATQQAVLDYLEDSNKSRVDRG